MNASHEQLGRTLLKGLVGLREKKGQLSLDDVGSLFVQISTDMSSSSVDVTLQEEIKRLANYIDDANREIFAISTNEKSEAVLVDASQHLDEVVKATEHASNSIMDAADVIQQEVSGVGGDKEKKITEATVQIYNACNFQDITGQRITKVIKLLGNIEERIGKLNSIVGALGLNNGPSNAANANAPLTDQDLLNGPQLSHQAASQDEIDQLFASLSGKN